ncbi:MAG: TetR/AcrR family transcriptional regulator, partial [Desulfuromonadaceae bacterium]|nr:TetR/AcrR family transcriptional regulator [Desulfuromonadaceae bacterium]
MKTATYILVGMKLSRNSDHTRQTILDAAAQEIHLHGFQAASLSRILATTGLTKGALYHHFPNKQALGYAVLEEDILVRGRAIWISPLEQC